MRILIAPDKFKGSLTSAQAAAAMETGFRAAIADLQCTTLPLADGGEGTADLFREALRGERRESPATDPLGRAWVADWVWLPERREAVIEMSAASGLWRLAAGERDPLKTSTRGTGDLLREAAAQGARRILLGLGGSATNDVGAGLAAALGFSFLDENGASLDPIPARFDRIVRIVPPETPFPVEIVALSDVTNPLLGPRGATRVYGPQKGATDLDDLERRVALLADLTRRDLGRDDRNTPGAGAAGGLGFGILTFSGGTIRSGFETCMELLDAPRHIAEADLVVTGEGRLDASSVEGKGPGGIARMARAAGKPVLAFAGAIQDSAALGTVFDACIPIVTHSMSMDAAMAEASILLTRAAERTARLLALRDRLPDQPGRRFSSQTAP